MLTFRTSLALVLFTSLAVLPVYGATVQPASGSKPAAHTAQKHTAQTHAAQTHTTQTHTTQTHAAQTHTAQAHTAQARGAHKGRSRSRRPRGQQVMEPGRITEIQQALIREHYLSGEANGNWDERTKAAMQKYQAAQGWQTKLTPDARALKKLGLGPDYSNAINTKNSTFAEPPPASTIPPAIAAGFAAAAGVK
ncbi:MAG: peptidoglycan-binding domain-containing protein [Terracidiphilus sp.]